MVTTEVRTRTRSKVEMIEDRERTAQVLGGGWMGTPASDPGSIAIAQGWTERESAQGRQDPPWGLRDQM